MSRFTRNPSPEQETAAQALRKLQEGPAGDRLDAVCAEAMESRLRHAWIHSSGPRLTGVDGEMTPIPACCAASIGNTPRRKRHAGTPCRHIPGDDHLRGWAQNGIITAVTIEPYGLDADELFELSDFCRKYSYRAAIFGESPHYAGHTILIAITQS